jgi:hypothetical protein
MNLDKLVYEVLTEVRELSDDGLVTEAYVAHLINVYRAKYIQQEYSKRNILNKSSVQSFNLAVKVVDSSNDPSLNIGTYILESDELPEILNVGKQPAIQRIRTLDSLKGEIDFMNMDRCKMSTHARFKTLNAYLDTNNRLYIIGNKDSSKFLGAITVDAVLEDPSDIVNYNYKSRSKNTEPIDYPIDLGMWASVKADIINNVLLSYKVPTDNVNNQMDDKEIRNAKQ